MNDLQRDILNEITDHWFPDEYLSDGSVRFDFKLEDLHKKLGSNEVRIEWLVEALKELRNEYREGVFFDHKLNGPIARNVSFVGEYVHLHLSNVYAFHFYGGSRERMKAFLAAQ